MVFFNLASSHPSALVSSHCSNESLLLSARSRAANSLSLNTLSSNPTADIGFRCALLPSFPCILHTKAALFNFLTLASGKCDGMRDRSQNKWAAAGNGRGLVKSTAGLATLTQRATCEKPAAALRKYRFILLSSMELVIISSCKHYINHSRFNTGTASSGMLMLKWKNTTR